jgi:hypothetical protein
MWGKEKMHTKVWLVGLKGRHHWEGLGIDRTFDVKMDLGI